jgi:hypothetical protein
VKNSRIGKRNPKKVPSILYRNVPPSVDDELRDWQEVYFEPKVDKFKLEKFAFCQWK